MSVRLDIADDVLAAARCLAEEEGVSLGLAVTILARRGMPPPRLIIDEDGLPVIDIDPRLFPTITDEDVARLLEGFP